eukprot:GGOE01043350.1.p1 GENE.GGOE01043350.1~~GGOE01043350.1.p1  ORF type:complete len:879 (+),score=209.68 GGOE01043350.1:57-2693(+)
MEAAVLCALREAIELKRAVFFDHTLGQFRVGRVAVPPDAVVGLRSVRLDEVDGRMYTMMEVYHFLLNINEYPDIYSQKARSYGVRPVKSSLQKVVYQEIVGDRPFDPTQWLTPIGTNPGLQMAASMRLQTMARPPHPNLPSRLEDPLHIPYGSRPTMAMATSSMVPSSVSPLIPPMLVQASPSTMPHAARGLSSMPSPHAMYQGHRHERVVPQHIVDSHPMDVAMTGRSVVYVGPEAAAYDRSSHLPSSQGGMGIPTPTVSYAPDILSLGMDASSTNQTAKAFLLSAKTELTTEEFRLFQDIVNQLKRAATDVEFVSFVRKCIRLLGTRWGLVEGLRSFMPGHLKQRYTEIMIEMSVSAHNAEGAGDPSSSTTTVSQSQAILAVLPELQDRLSPKVYQQFQDSLQQFYSIRSMAEFDAIAKKWIELLGRGNALIDDLLCNAPAKIKERYAQILREVTMPKPSKTHDGRRSRKGRRGSRSPSCEASPNKSRKKRKQRSTSHSKAVHTPIAEVGTEAEAASSTAASAALEEERKQVIEAAQRRFMEGVADLLAHAQHVLPGKHAALADHMRSFQCVRTAEEFDAAAAKAAELLCEVPELAQSLGSCMPGPLRRRFRQLMSEAMPWPAPEAQPAFPDTSPSPTSTPTADMLPALDVDDSQPPLMEEPLDAEPSPELPGEEAEEVDNLQGGEDAGMVLADEEGRTESAGDGAEEGEEEERVPNEVEEEGGEDMEVEEAQEQREGTGTDDGGLSLETHIPCAAQEVEAEAELRNDPPPKTAHQPEAPEQRFRALVASVLAARPKQCMAIALLTNKLQQEHRKEYRRFVQPTPEAYFSRHFTLISHGSSLFVRADDAIGPKDGRTLNADGTGSSQTSEPFVTPQ